MALRDGKGRAAEGPLDHPEPSPDAYDNVASDPTCDEWRPIPSFVGLYEATADGRVSSVDRVITDVNNVTKRLRGRELRACDGQVTLSQGGVTKRFSVRSLVRAAWGGDR